MNDTCYNCCSFAVKYNIKLVLGEVKGSGTDGNVYIQLFGAKGNTAKIQLRQAEDVTNRFETDQEYKFVVTTSDIGKVHCTFNHAVVFMQFLVLKIQL